MSPRAKRRNIAFIRQPTVVIGASEAGPILAALAEVRRHVEGSPALLALAEELREAADDWETLRSSAGSDRGTDRAPIAEPVAPSDWLTSKEAADHLRVSTRRVRALLADGHLAGQQRGGSWFISRDALRRFAAGR